MCSRLVGVILALCAVAAAGKTDAFPIGPQAPPTSPVYEYFNTVIGHYFYTLDPAELAVVDSGGAGPGWSRTGLSFFAHSSIEQSGDSYFPACDKRWIPCVAVSRFHGTPGLGPDSHFLTGNPADVAILSQPGSGWTYERLAFAIPVPDPATGQCAPGHTPVYRFYNNRWMHNDSNHRYTTSEAVRSRMLAQGWADEGIAFCAYGDGHAPTVLHSVDVKDRSGIRSAGACDAESSLPHSCIAIGDLSVPTVEFSGAESADEFNARTGIFYMGNPRVRANVALVGDSRDAAARDVFVQLSDWGNVFGMHLVAPARAGEQYSSIAPMRRLPISTPATGSTDARLFPFRAQFNTEYELRLDFTAGVNRLLVSEGSHAYGVATIEFLDSRSGGRFRAHILAYGTAQEGDFVGRDATDGAIFVATSFKPQSPFGRNVSGLTVHMPANHQPLAPHLPGPYIWYVNRDEFQAMVDNARSLDPALSTDPGDYLVASFGIRNQIYGSGDMGLYLFGTSLSLMPR